MKNKIIMIFFASLFLGNGLIARECKSVLGAHFKPLYENAPIQWAGELKGSGGNIQGSALNRYYYNSQFILGLEFNINENIFYLEPAIKYWKKSDPPLENRELEQLLYPLPQKRHFGFREFSISPAVFNNNLLIGLQSMSFSGISVLDERVLGLAYDNTYKQVDLAFRSGTVSRDFSRMEDFCGTRHVYSILHEGPYTLVGDQPGETNFVGSSINWFPERESEPGLQASGDQFSEFNEFESFSNESKPELINNMGLLLFQEFGKGFDDNPLYLGAFMNLNLPLEIKFENEFIYQSAKNSRLLAHIWRVSRSINWISDQTTDLSLAYYGSYGFDSDSRFTPAFSSLFMGEVVRLDARDVPLIMASIRRQINLPFNPSIKIAFVRQLYLNHTAEFDLEVKIDALENIDLYGTFSAIESHALQGKAGMVKLEGRWGF